MTVVPIRLVDRLGRKPLLVAGLGGMITSLTILGVSSLGLPEPNAPGDPAAIITLCAWPASSPRSRRRGARVVWVLQSFPLALDSFGPGPVFFGYAVIGLLALLFVKTMVTETRGRSLEEIEADLQEATGAADEGEQRFTREPASEPAPGRTRAGVVLTGAGRRWWTGPRPSAPHGRRRARHP